jgi:hypothetical protein
MWRSITVRRLRRRRPNCPIVKRYTGAVAPYDPPEKCHYGFALTGDKLCFANKWKSKTGMPACNH